MDKDKPKSMAERSLWYIRESWSKSEIRELRDRMRTEGLNTDILDEVLPPYDESAKPPRNKPVPKPKSTIDKSKSIIYDDNHMIIIKELKCKRCGRSWMPRKKELPTQCPKCKSPYWNKDRKK